MYSDQNLKSLIKEKISKKIQNLKSIILDLDKQIENSLLEDSISPDQLKKRYIERDRYKLDLKKTSLALENLKLKKKKIRPKVEIVLENISVNKNYIIFNGIWVGKNETGNDLVYKKNKYNTVTWFHARVRGGGLVAAPLGEDLNLAASLALIYSKYLTVYGSTVGQVSYSNNIKNTSIKGSFIFSDTKTVLVQSSPKLYFSLKDDKLKISLIKEIGSFGVVFTPSLGCRFADLERRIGFPIEKIKNKVVLESIIPYKWDLAVD